MSAASVPDEHTWTPEELRAQLRVTKRRRAQTDRVVSRGAELTDHLAAVTGNPDHFIERLRAIIQGG